MHIPLIGAVQLHSVRCTCARIPRASASFSSTLAVVPVFPYENRTGHLSQYDIPTRAKKVCVELSAGGRRGGPPSSREARAVAHADREAVRTDAQGNGMYRYAVRRV